VDLDRGVLFTFTQLLRHPGATVRAYLSGRTGRYTNPFKYLLLSLATVAVAWWLAKRLAGGGAPVPAASPPAGAAASYAWRIGRYSATYGLTAWALLIVFSAGFARLLFRRARLSFAEHLLFATYTSAQIIFLAGLLVAAVHAIPRVGIDGFDVAFLLAAGWYLCAATAFFGGGRLRALPRALLVLLLSALSYFAVGLAAIAAALRLGVLR
jgi:hypothetical protein